MTREAAIVAAAMSDLEPLARVVLLCILGHGHCAPAGDAVVWASTVADLAARAGISERACRGRLDALEALGHVSRDGRARGPMVSLVTLFQDVSRHVVPVERHDVQSERHVAPVERHVVPNESILHRAENVTGDDAARGAGLAARGAGGTAGATQAGARARDSLSEQIMISMREVDAESGVVRASERARTHEAPPMPEVSADSAPESTGPMRHPFEDDEPEAAPTEPSPGRLACEAWERALDVRHLPGGHVDAIRAALEAHGLDVVTQAADRFAAYLATRPQGRSFGLRQPRVVTDRVAEVVAAASGKPAGVGPHWKPINTCPKFWAEQAAKVNAQTRERWPEMFQPADPSEEPPTW